MKKRREPFKNLQGWFIAGREFLWSYWIVIVLAIVAAYLAGDWLDSKAWSGFHGRKYGDAKTLWDWLDLLIVPIVLAIGAYVFDRRAKNRDQAREAAAQEREIKREEEAKERDREWEDSNRQEEILQDYLDDMSQLLMDKKLKAVMGNYHNTPRYEPHVEVTGRAETMTGGNLSVVDLARARTVSTLRRLKDPQRRDELLDFLRDAGLYKNETPLLREAKMNNINLEKTNLAEIDLNDTTLQNAQLVGVNLRDANLDRADLQSANLAGANLLRANLERADLQSANLTGASLWSANLAGANLLNAKLGEADLRRASLASSNLWEATLVRAKLMEADLAGANLAGAHLVGAKLIGADLVGANLAGARFDEETVLPDGSYWHVRVNMTQFTEPK